MLYCYETVNGTLNAENCFLLLHKKAKCYLNLPCVYLITQMAAVLSLKLAYQHQTMPYKLSEVHRTACTLYISSTFLSQIVMVIQDCIRIYETGKSNAYFLPLV